MVSYTSLKFYLNAAFESISILFLIVILFSCIFRKTTNKTKKEFSVFVVTLIFLLFGNMIMWILDGMRVSPMNRPELYTFALVLTILDFFLYTLICIFFLNYVLALTEIEHRKRRILIHTLVAYCFVTTGIFSTSLPSGWLYSIYEDGYIHYNNYYPIFVLISNPSLGLSFFYSFKSIHTLKAKTIPLFCYIWIPILLTLFDAEYGLATSYICLAFSALCIYVSVDIKTDRDLLQNEATIAKHESEMTELKFRLMMSQIQPHFLYNTLGTIYQLCGSDAELARKAIKNFTKYLQANVESLEQCKLVSFEKEMEHTRTYLSIELLRFQGSLKVECNIECTDFKIPALSLQPLVENAVKHGICSRENGGTVTITSKRQDGKIFILVHDDGIGFNPADSPKDERLHLGIDNVRRRIEYSCGGTLEIKSQVGVGTTATIILEDTNREFASYR